MNQVLTRSDGVKWTESQQQAIHATGSDILVAAAAGSGKTAVLVQRIIEKIMNTDHPVDIDRLLVMTFTNAAAAEMRTRIGEALEKELTRQHDSVYLRRQISLLGKAKISTIHSFCIDIVRSHFYLLDLDPGFRIASETERALLLDEAIQQLMEKEYSDSDNELFLRVVNSFTSDRSDERITTLLTKLFEAALSHPNPEKWLTALVAPYQIEPTDQITDISIYPLILADIQFLLSGAMNCLHEAKRLCLLPDGPQLLSETIEQDIIRLEQFQTAIKEDWQLARDLVAAGLFSRAKAIKAGTCNSVLKERAGMLRNEAKEQLQTISKRYFAYDPGVYLQDIQTMTPVIGKLADLVKQLHVIFTNLKRVRNVVDFSDVEHLALQVLLEHKDDGTVIYSDVAKAYQDYFAEVLIDEYQDTNQVQEAILQAVTKNLPESGNLFMVGDVKQAIYRFRLADPSLFMKKYEQFSKPEAAGKQIDLNQNFRSRTEVLDGTNYLFQQLMDQQVGEIDYHEDARLYLGANYPADQAKSIEVCLLDMTTVEAEDAALTEHSEDEEQLSNARFEAQEMAKSIKKMMTDQTMVYDLKRQEYRPLEYRDIVILHRSKAWYPEIVDVFRQFEIPIYAEARSGYFDTVEVSNMLQLLQLIDNSYQDIPLASVLRSPIVGLTSEELAQIRLLAPKAPFYEAVKLATTSTGVTQTLQTKVALFLKKLAKWTSESKHMSVANLIWAIYRDSYYLDFVAGLPRGKERQANLLGLYNRANEFEKSSFSGIFRFLRFIERLRARGDDLGEVASIGEQENVIRLMSIHASKGLEFPVVLLGGLGKNFNKMDLHSAYIWDQTFGIAVKYVDPERRVMRDTLFRHVLQNRKQLEMISEEMRILYVAMTRAKEKLILFATTKNVEKYVEQWALHQQNSDWLLAAHTRASARNYLEWLGPALMRHANVTEQLQASFTQNYDDGQYVDKVTDHPSKWQLRLIQQTVAISEREKESAGLKQELQQFEQVAETSSKRDQVIAQMRWQYPFIESTKLKAKQSVTEIKRLSLELDERVGEDLLISGTGQLNRRENLAQPGFLHEKSITAAERGTIMHLVMEHIDLTKEISFDMITEQLDKLVRLQLLTAAQAKVVDRKQILQFYQSEIGQRLINAKKSWREVPFSLMLPIIEVYPHWQESTDEKILVQGIIDCMFLNERDELVLVDYKTDRIFGSFVEAKQDLYKRYQKQIALYAQAIEQITKKTVAERYLYFFEDGGHLLSVDILN